ncbi:hypothetical protein K413DRAFT_4655 [Clostridium sp. ASBs410]|nr:hypothetical protein K413DRAFT_4655 [Clostridium sp. ASBs410]
MLLFELNNGKRMKLDECVDMIEATLYDENGVEIDSVDWLADTVCEMLFDRNEN